MWKSLLELRQRAGLAVSFESVARNEKLGTAANHHEIKVRKSMMLKPTIASKRSGGTCILMQKPAHCVKLIISTMRS